MARAIAKAGKQQEANTRGLTGNRNAQGDFMPEDVQMKGTQDSVTPDIQNYVDDVKAQIDEIDAQIESITQDPNYYMPANIPDGQGGSTSSSVLDDLDKQLGSLYAQKDQLLDDLITNLEENNIPIPDEVMALAHEQDIKAMEDAMRKEDAEEQDQLRAYQNDPDPTGGWAEWNSM